LEQKHGSTTNYSSNNDLDCDTNDTTDSAASFISAF